MIVVAVVAALVVHEAGHFAAARALRLPARLVLTRHGPGVAIGSDDLRLEPRQIRLTAAAGPAANVALAALASGGLAPLPELALLSLVFAAANLIPLRRSDGHRLIFAR